MDEHKYTTKHKIDNHKDLLYSTGSYTQFFVITYKGNWASLVAQLVKNLTAMQEMWVQFLGWEDALEKGPATHSSILAWRIPWTI